MPAKLSQHEKLHGKKPSILKISIQTTKNTCNYSQLKKNILKYSLSILFDSLLNRKLSSISARQYFQPNSGCSAKVKKYINSKC